MAIRTTQGVRRRAPRQMNGWLALSPLLVFLAVYVVSSLVARDFYKVPVTAAFLIASAYALLITPKGTTDSKVAVFSTGAGDRNVLFMVWIFVLAGAFAATARDIGAVDATVALALRVLPGRLLLAGLFLAACFISMAVGTSVGTIVALVPIATGIASGTGLGVPYVTAIIVGGAFFGDNLSFISDTTVAATRSQEVSMRDKFRVNVAVAAPAALIVTGIYIVQGGASAIHPVSGSVDLLRILPYILVIGLAIAGMNVVTVLALGVAVNGVIGLATGSYGWTGYLSAIGSGVADMGGLILVSLLAGGLLEMVRYNGGMEFIIRGLTRRVRGKVGAELCIAALVSLVNICTANNTIAIITTGRIAADITRQFGLDPRKTASILDTFSCMVQGILPYGAQMLMAAGLAGVSAVSIIAHLHYPFFLGGCALLSILLRFPRRYS